METATENRKTFRLDTAAADSLATAKRNHSNENAAINHVLVAWPKKIAQQEQQLVKLRDDLQQAESDGRAWKTKQETTQRELDQLKNALALIGKFLNPAE